MGEIKRFNCDVDEEDYMEVDTFTSSNMIYFQIFNENTEYECAVGIEVEKARELVRFLESELRHR